MKKEKMDAGMIKAMGNSKRGLGSVEEAGEGQHMGNSSGISMPSKKKTRNEKKIIGEEIEKDSSSVISKSFKPMEQKKKRKALDKERHRAVSENDESKPNCKIQQSKFDDTHAKIASSASNGFPEFHISVFKNLASAEACVREVGAETMVSELKEVQMAYDKLDKKELFESELQLEAEKDDGLNNCAPSMRYALRRLVRGVSSSRECARQGFALGLSLLFATVPSIKIDSLLNLISNLLEVTSSMKGQEARDCLLGRLFAYGAITRSGRLANAWIIDNNTPYIKKFTALLISLASKKRYLQEPVISVLLDLVEKLPPDAVLSHILRAPGLPEWFEGATDRGNPDALLLALKLREKISDIRVIGKLLPYPFTLGKFFSSGHLSSLANCLKESTFCQPRVHGVWPVLVNLLLPDIIAQDGDLASGLSSIKKHRRSRKYSSTEEDNAKWFQCFCEVVIEGCLLSSSHDRKHLAFDVILLCLPRLPASLVPIVLSYRLVQCLLDVLSTKDSWLYKVAHRFLADLSDWIENDDIRRVAVILALQKHSSGKFDCITRTKTIKEMLSKFNTESGCMLFIQNLKDLFLDEGDASEEPSDQSQTTDDNSEVGSMEEGDSVGTSGNSDILKSWIVESLPTILKYLKLQPEAKYRVKKEILKFLAVQGLFSASLGTEVTSLELQEKFNWPKAATSVALCKMCIQQLQLLLATAQKEDDPFIGLNGELGNRTKDCSEQYDLGSYFMQFLSTLHNIPSVSLFRSLSNEDEKTIRKLQSMEACLFTRQMSFPRSTDANQSHALRYLLIQLLLQVLARPGEFLEAASEAIMCCKKSYPSPDLSDCSEEDETVAEEIPAVMDALVDTLLSLLAQSSTAMRLCIELVFKNFSEDMPEISLIRMLRIIKKDLKPARHQNAAGDEYEDVDDFIDFEEAEESDEAEMGITGESDEKPDNSRAAGVEAAMEMLPDDSDDSDGGMDDDAMFRMDSYLAQIFKERKNHAGGDSTHSQLVLFKLRVLSLLEIYLHECAGEPQMLLIYSNLAQVFLNPSTAEGSEQLGQRIWSILNKKIFKAKECPVRDIEISTLESLFEKNLKLASKPFKRKKSASTPPKKQSSSWKRYKMIVSLAQNSIFWFLRTIDRIEFPLSELQGVIDIFRSALASYFESKKSQLRSDFLKEVFRKWPWLGHQLFGFLLEKCSSSRSDFRRVEALDLVMEILKSLVFSGNNKNGKADAASNEVLRKHLPQLCYLVKEFVAKMPEKQSRRAEFRKFCGKVFQILSTVDLSKTFLDELSPDARAACESQLGAHFLALKRQ